MDAHSQADPLLYAFGSVEGMAAVSFLDAWWNPADNKSPFAFDTITNHHPSYYTQDAALPLETENPIPVAYLALKRGVKFTIPILFPDDSWREGFGPVLERALRNGIGAKVAQGYGRFKILGNANPQTGGPTTTVQNAVPGEADVPPTPGDLPDNPSLPSSGKVTLQGRVVSNSRSTLVLCARIGGETRTFPAITLAKPFRAEPNDPVTFDVQIQNTRPSIIQSTLKKI